MRTKALLVDAQAGSQGPKVNLERGVWEIDSHPHVEVLLSEGDIEHLNGVVRIVGPARVGLNVNPEYVGPGINAQAKCVEK